MIQCYHPRCLRNEMNPIKLRTMFNMKEFLLHLEGHVDDIGIAMQKRFGAVHRNQFLNSEDLDSLAPAPSHTNDYANNLAGDPLAHLYRCIDSYGIERILVNYSDEDLVKLSDSQWDNVIPKNPHYLSHWSDILISHKVITPSSLIYQENDAFIYSILQFPDPVTDWSIWGTVYMYALKMYTSVSGAGLNLLRGITWSRVTRRDKDLVDIYEFARGINHPCPSVSSCQRILPELKYENKTHHASELLFHIACLEKSEESFKFDFSTMVTRFPVCVVIDEQEINQGTFIKNGELCGLKEKMNAADIREVGLENLAKYIAEENNFIVAVRENILVDLKGICCSNAVTTFESECLKSKDCLDKLDDVTEFSNSCQSCLINGWTCEYSSLDEMCSKCVESDIKCISLVVFHVLWDMGSGHKKAAKRTSNGLKTTSTDQEMMSPRMHTLGFGGLHIAKAYINCMRNHVLQYDGEYYGTDMLLAMRSISDNLQLIKNAVFVGKDRQSDRLAYLTVCPSVQEALKEQGNCWVQRIPEKYLSYKKNAKSQKEIVFGVDVCVNRNGDVFVLDAGAACIHVIDRSNVAAVIMMGKYNTPDLEAYSTDNTPKNTVKNLKMSNSLFDLCMDDHDNLYVTDCGRAEVIIVQKCIRAKSCQTTANFYVIDVPEILSSAVMANQLFVLRVEGSEKVVQLLSYHLPKKCVKNFNLQYTVSMTVPCNIKRLISVPFNKYFGGQDDENALKLFWYSKSRGIIKLEKPLNLNSCMKPFISSDGYILTGTGSGIDVHRMYGKGLIEHSSTHQISGLVNALSLNGKVITAVVTVQNTTSVLQNSPLGFGIEFSSALCKLYNAIGYVPPRGNEDKSKLTLEQSISEARVSVDLLAAMQQETQDRTPGRRSFRGADGMPATGTINCLESTVDNWEVLKERLERIEEGSSARVHSPAVACENNVEHFFGFVTRKGQGNNQDQEEYLIAKRRHSVENKFKMANVPFSQHEKEKVRDKGYQDIEHDRFPLTVEALKDILMHSNKEDYTEIENDVPAEDSLLLKKAYLLSKSVPRQSNRAKWREKSGYNPSMLSDSSSAGVLNKDDLVLSRSETDELVFFIVQEKFLLDDINRSVPVRKVGSTVDTMVSCTKLLEDKGQIFVVPAQLYTVDEGDVVFNDTVTKHIDPLLHAQAQVMSDEDWSVMLDEPSGCSSDDTNYAVKIKKGKRKLETANECAKVKPVGDDIVIGMRVTVLYEGQEFPGEVMKYVAIDRYEVKCMEKGGGIGSTWRWPTVVDKNSYDRSEIIKKNISIKRLPGTDRVMEYHVPELDDVWGKPLTKTLDI